MAAAEELVQKLAQQSIATFPGAMHWPLVAAGVVRAGTDEFLARSTNVMQLPSPTEYRLVHAEEVLFEAHALATEDIEVVITLEPCQERQGEGEAQTPCCERIVRFAASNPGRLKRVVVGAYADGRGIEVMAKRGLPVVLLHGPEHSKHILKGVEGRIQEIRSRVSGAVELRTVADLDPLNREAYLRRWAFMQEREAVTDKVLRWLVHESATPGVDLVAGLLSGFPTVFWEQHRAALIERLPTFRNDPEQPVDPRRARGFVYHAVSRSLYRERSLRVEAELRGQGTGTGGQP